MTDTKLRADLDIIANWIQPKQQVLDLGCGSGLLLDHLIKTKGITGYGLEIEEDAITECIRKGINVIQQDLDKGLDNFEDHSVDTIVMTQAVQAVKRPDLLLDEMLRVADEAIITFPNFGHWSCRFYLLFKGRMPMSEALPFSWYDTPNIHLCTFKDFEALCYDKGIKVVNRTVVDNELKDSWAVRLWPNMLGQVAIYHITKR
ncbi:methionine biosynthesis protein MetW [Litoribrevibacter albus]|uniref:Methionine biosynthesis protein MetW n=1 Tax=Litoribrevibacter albus TaxID=1473156 RepID=A0AA37S7G0_9GAMM|nr:methionine biosynthesis protein MetW [Litoribrevibacter albus]